MRLPHQMRLQFLQRLWQLWHNRLEQSEFALQSELPSPGRQRYLLFHRMPALSPAADGNIQFSPTPGKPGHDRRGRVLAQPAFPDQKKSGRHAHRSLRLRVLGSTRDKHLPTPGQQLPNCEAFQVLRNVDATAPDNPVRDHNALEKVPGFPDWSRFLPM